MEGGQNDRLHLDAAGLAPQEDSSYLRDVLLAYEARDAHQERERERMLRFLAEHDKPLERSCLEGHFTASALLIHADGQRALLTHHRKLGRWLQLGGHCDGEANPARTALLEASEESGMPALCIDPRPVDLDIHRIPARRAEPEHDHLDLRYLVYAPPGAREEISAESLQLAWVSPSELERLTSDDSVRRLYRIAFA